MKYYLRTRWGLGLYNVAHRSYFKFKAVLHTYYIYGLLCTKLNSKAFATLVFYTPALKVLHWQTKASSSFLSKFLVFIA